MSSTISLFQGFCITQTRMVVLSIIHGLRRQPKLKAILEGWANLDHSWLCAAFPQPLLFEGFFPSKLCKYPISHITNKWAGAPMLPTPGTNWLKQCLMNLTKKTISKRPGAGAQAVFNQCRCAQSPYQVAFVWAQLGSKDGAAGLKHHGSEGRIGPAAGSPECQTLLS